MSERLNLRNVNLAGNYRFPDSHPCITNPTRGTTIDYCLCTDKVLQNVKYATMAPYDLGVLGDHRGFIIDVDIKNMLKINKETTDHTRSRKLVTSNLKATTKYLQLVEEKFKKQNIVKRVNKMFRQWQTKKKNKWETKTIYEKLDTEIYHICKTAEKKCRKTVSGNYDWSPKLASAIKQLAYWRARKRHKNNTSVIKKLGKETGISYSWQSQEEIDNQINISRELLKNVQESAIIHRKKHLNDLAEKYARENKIAKSKAIQELIAHESIRSTFGLLRGKLKQNTRSQLTKIWVAQDETGKYVKDPTNRRVIEDETKIHKHLLRRNIQQLTQAKETPFANGELAKKLKWDGTGDLGRDVLSGDILNKYKFESTIQLYLESLKVTNMSKQLNITKPQISIEEYKKFWKKKKEETATSPFGLHIGHYKAALQKDHIINVHRIMLLIPFQTALVPNRWKKTVQTMLEKDPGHPWIHRLRIIELFDSQVNAGFQIFIGRKMVWSAVERNKLHESSYGSTQEKWLHRQYCSKYSVWTN